LTLTPVVANILKNCSFEKFANNILTIALNESFATLLTDNLKIQIDNVLKNHCKVVINISKNTNTQTLAQKEKNIANKQLNQAQNKFFKDGGVIALQEIFETKFNEKSIRSI
jgi:hypothetical protein